jgi:hypothetical protein
VQDLEEFTVAWLKRVEKHWLQLKQTREADEMDFMSAGQVAMPTRSKPITFFKAERMQDYFPDMDNLLGSALYTTHMQTVWTAIADGDTFCDHVSHGKVKKVVPTEDLQSCYEQMFSNYAVRWLIVTSNSMPDLRAACLQMCVLSKHTSRV